MTEAVPTTKFKIYGRPTSQIAPFVPPALPDLSGAVGVTTDHVWAPSQINPRTWSDTILEIPDAINSNATPMFRYVLDTGAAEAVMGVDSDTGIIYIQCSGIDYQAVPQLRPSVSTPYSFFVIFQSPYSLTAPLRLGGVQWGRWTVGQAHINLGNNQHMLDPRTASPNSSTNINNFLVMGANLDPTGPIGNFDGIAVTFGAAYTPPTSNPFFQPSIIVSDGGGALNSKVAKIAYIASVPAYLNAANLAAGVEALRAFYGISYS